MISTSVQRTALIFGLTMENGSLNTSNQGLAPLQPLLLKLRTCYPEAVQRRRFGIIESGHLVLMLRCHCKH